MLRFLIFLRCVTLRGNETRFGYMDKNSHFTPEYFNDLVLEHHVPLRAFIRTLGVEQAWVDDLAQESFLVAYRELNSFNQELDFGKWLRGIARNLVRNELRKNARRKRLLHEGLAELLQQQAEDEPNLLELCRMSALRDCVEQLPGKSRELVAGRYRDGWESGDLAEQVGMSAEAVRQALVRIRRQLKQCIEYRVAEAGS